MDVGEVVAIALAGLAAGAINTVVGSGTLITFPVLLAFGYAPVTANVSNTIGLVPGSLSGAVGYRRELAGQGRRALRRHRGDAIDPRTERPPGQILAIDEEPEPLSRDSLNAMFESSLVEV